VLSRSSISISSSSSSGRSRSTGSCSDSRSSSSNSSRSSSSSSSCTSSSSSSSSSSSQCARGGVQPILHILVERRRRFRRAVVLCERVRRAAVEDRGAERDGLQVAGQQALPHQSGVPHREHAEAALAAPRPAVGPRTGGERCRTVDADLVHVHLGEHGWAVAEVA
jgi:hypothetical protein